MSRALWWVTKGLAVAPPGMGCIMGVSTSRKAPAVEELPQQADDPGPGLEDPAHLGVDHQVQVALAVAGLDVGEAVEFFRQGLQGFGQEHKLLHCQGELVGPGAEQGALDPDDVAQIHGFLKRAKASSPSTCFWT